MINSSTGHNWVNASCTEPKYCSDCYETTGSALGHTTRNGVCSRCKETLSLEDFYSISLPTYDKRLNYYKTLYISGEKVNVSHDNMRIDSDIEYTLTDNHDGTANLQLKIIVWNVKPYYEKLTTAYFETRLLGEGDTAYRKRTAVMLSEYAERRIITEAFNNLLPGDYGVAFFEIDDSW